MLITRFYLSPEGDMGGASSAAPATPAPTTSSTGVNGNYPGNNDPLAMFDMLEQYYRESSDTRPYNESARDYQDPTRPTQQQPGQQEQQEKFGQQEQQLDENGQPLEKPEQEGKFKPLKVKVGEQEFEIKSEKQVQKLVERSQLAGELYQEYQKLKTEHAESTADLQYLEKLATDSPHEFMDTLADNISQEDLVSWMRNKVQFFKLSDEDKARYQEYQKAKESMRREEVLRQQLEEVKQKEQQVKQQQEVAQLKQTQNVLASKYAEVVGQDWFDKVVRMQIQEAARLQRAGEQVSITRFKAMIESVIEPVYQKLKPAHKPTQALKSSMPNGGVGNVSDTRRNPTADDGFNALLAGIRDGRVV